MKQTPFFIAFIALSHAIFSQGSDPELIKAIFDSELRAGQSHAMLKHLTGKIGHRLSGSEGAVKAVDWTASVMKEFSDSVWLQPVTVPHWVRGRKETAKILGRNKKHDINVNVCALGGSSGTGAAGITSKIIEVKNFEDLRNLGEEKVRGKIVFFNRPLDPSLINTFSAYGGGVNQRSSGASEAAKLGAAGVVVRSMGSGLEDYPHTGGLRYQPDVPKIPAIAISTSHAELLSSEIKRDPDLRFYFQTNCETLPDAQSFNVIGEMKGSQNADEIILVGGHLDSWDLGEGAHDDGAGCVQAMSVLRILKNIGYKPRRTIRAVMYMNEENGLRGGTEYARQSELKQEKHIAAIESDRGGFTPRGFTMTASDHVKAKVKSWKYLLEKYGLTDFEQEGGGADIAPLLSQQVPLFGYLPDSQRYFRYHHTAEDTFDKVDKRELELGAASIAALVYLIDRYGL